MPDLNTMNTPANAPVRTHVYTAQVRQARSLADNIADSITDISAEQSTPPNANLKKKAKDKAKDKAKEKSKEKAKPKTKAKLKLRPHLFRKKAEQPAPVPSSLATRAVFNNTIPPKCEPGDYTTRLSRPAAVRTASQTRPRTSAYSATSTRPEADAKARANAENLRPLGFGERMLRNTAVCVAILLCVLAVKTIDTPLTQSVSAELREWVTMDFDESLGSLKFVHNLLPDAALVFWHIGSSQTYSEPCMSASMTLSHSWRDSEPYLTYSGGMQQPVLAAQAGEVMSVTPSGDGNSTIRIRHGDGLETIYGGMASCTVREGDGVTLGQVIGAASTLYFEIRGEGRSMNPAPLMAEKP